MGTDFVTSAVVVAVVVCVASAVSVLVIVAAAVAADVLSSRHGAQFSVGQTRAHQGLRPLCSVVDMRG